MKRIGLAIVTLVFVALVGTADAFALELGSAKNQGLVGETLSGYLEPVSANPSQEVRNLVADINSRRKQEYQKIASSNNTSLESVQALAGKKAIENTSPGNYIKNPTGAWQRK